MLSLENSGFFLIKSAYCDGDFDILALHEMIRYAKSLKQRQNVE